MDQTTPPQLPPQFPPQLPHEKSLGDDAGVRLLLPVGRSWWAIAAGYFGLLAVIPVFAPPAIICGVVGIVDIKRSKLGPRPKHGMVRAWFGIVMGVIGTGIGVFFAISMMGG